MNLFQKLWKATEVERWGFKEWCATSEWGFIGWGIKIILLPFALIGLLIFIAVSFFR